MSIRIVNLTKEFGSQKAVDDISFEVKKGEIVGFLGPNGAGKSTTMKIATCYLPPTSGAVEVGGFDVVANPMQVRKITGYLPEHNPLYLDMYVHEYLAFICSLHSIKGTTMRSRIKEMINLCGLTIEQNKKIGSLSKGYRQRVGLAQSLLHDPQVLILDEPTTGLDPNQIVEIRNLITNISREKTVVFSTHIMQEVQAICNRVIIINSGKIVADDSVNSLKAAPAGHQLITVEFSDSVDVELLKAIPGVKEVKEDAHGKYIIHADASRDVRGDIFNFATLHQKVLLGMNLNEISLENIFQQLTKK